MHGDWEDKGKMMHAESQEDLREPSPPQHADGPPG